MPGQWTVQAQEDPDNRVMILTDLRMEVTPVPNRMVVGRHIPVQVSFTDRGKPVTRPAFTTVLDLSLRQVGPKGMQHAPLTLHDDGHGGDARARDGRFDARFVPEGGHAELVVNADGKTFQRENRQVFELLMPATAELTPAGAGGKLQLRVEPVAEAVDPASLAASAELVAANGALTPVALARSQDGNLSGSVDPASIAGKAQLRVRVTAHTRGGEAVTANLAPMTVHGSLPATAAAPAAAHAEAQAQARPATAEGREGGEDRTTLWIGFGATNLVLVVLAGLGFWLLRRRRDRDLVQLVDEEPKPAPAASEPAEAKEEAA
jgi:uncharacterized protein (TIGR03503 family)